MRRFRLKTRKRTRKRVTLSILFAAVASAVLLKPSVADAPPAPLFLEAREFLATSKRLEDLLDDARAIRLRLEEKVAQKQQEQMRREVVSEVTGLPLDVSDVLIRQADEYGFSLHNVLGLISVETGGTFDWTLVGGPNSDGTLDWGLMQLNDGGTLQWLQSVTPGLSAGDPLDPAENVKMGMWYLHHISTQICTSDWKCTTSRYNGDQTGHYARLVEEHASRMSHLLREAWERRVGDVR